MLKEFSKLTFGNFQVLENDKKLINNFPVFQSYTKELNQMSSIKFYASNSYYSVLKMSTNVNKLARLTINDKFVEQFNENLNKFVYYREDLQGIIDVAIKVKGDLLIVESRLRNIFDNFLPQVVIRVLADNLKLDDLPLE